MGTEFKPNIQESDSYVRPCNCGINHEVEIFRGQLNYQEASNTIYCAALVEHHGSRHVWLSFITGEWPNTNESDCYVTIHIWVNDGQQIMRIEDSVAAPFEKEEVYSCYPVSRDQIFAVGGAKDWVIKVYLLFFELHPEAGNYLIGNVA